MRLYLRIYLTFVAGLFLAGFGAFALTYTLLGSPRVGFFEPRLRSFARQLGFGSGGGISASVATAIQSGDRARIQASLDELGRDLRMRVTVFDAKGSRYASTRGDVAPPASGHLDRLARGEVAVERRGGLHAYAPVLRDGKLLAVVGVAPLFGGHARDLVRPAVWLMGFLLGMAALTYPVAWGMSRRLERLTQVAHGIASGQLHARADVGGRDEIATLSRAMNDMASRVQELLGGQKELVAAVSHELRSPLARLKVSLEMAMDESGGQEARARHLADVEADIADLEQLVNDLLLASRLELADFPLSPEPLDLAALAREVAARYAGVVVTASGEARLRGDGKLLRRVVTNLLENARRASPPESPVEVALQSLGTEIVLEVRDRGPGVPEAERERIFEPFYRVDPSRSRDSGGAGLGLAIARRIALRHGGKLTVRDAPGGGAIFSLGLPRQ